MSDRAPDLFDARAPGAEICPILPTAIDPDAMSVVRRLQSAGHKAYFVGGCVRDLLLGGTPKDFDIATSARPRQVKKLFRNARIIGRRFRLVHVIFPGHKQIEVSTFRRDPNESGGEGSGASTADYGEEAVNDEPLVDELGGEPADRSDGRSDGHSDGDDESRDLLIREDNVYGTEAEDAVRRDFTINGLFYDVQSEEVIDYVGGVPDLRRRVLRTIGDASRRLREDPVRILRAVKFSTRLGLGFDPLLAAAMADHHEDLTRSAPPRVFEEILRILGGAGPERAVEVLIGLGVFRVLFPEMVFDPRGAAADPRLARLLARLRAMGELDRGRRSMPTAIYLATLFWDELIERLVGSAIPTEEENHAPNQSMDDFLRPLGQRCRMAKRDTARVRAAMLALRRIDPRYGEAGGKKRRRRGGMAEFVRREFYGDALLLMEITYRADGLDLAPVQELYEKREELAGAPRREGDDPPSRPSQRPPPRRAPAETGAASVPVNEPPSEVDSDSPLHRRRRRRRIRRQELFGAPQDSPKHDEGDPA